MMHHNAFTLYAKCYLSATAAYDLCKIWWPGPKRLNVLSVSNLYFAYVPPTFYLRPVHVPFVFDALNQILNANFYVRPAGRNLMYATTTATTNPPESSNMTNYSEPTQMVNLLQKQMRMFWTRFWRGSTLSEQCPQARACPTCSKCLNLSDLTPSLTSSTFSRKIRHDSQMNLTRVSASASMPST